MFEYVKYLLPKKSEKITLILDSSKAESHEPIERNHLLNPSNQEHDEAVQSLQLNGYLEFETSSNLEHVYAFKKVFSNKFRSNVYIRIRADIYDVDENSKNGNVIWRDLSSQGNKNIQNLLDFIKTETLTYIVTPYLDNFLCLNKYLKDSGALSESKARSIFKGLVEAVKFCHDQGIGRLDIIPENVLVGRNDEVKLTDFSFVTRENPVSCERCGTPGMLAPEQRDCGYYDPLVSDMWQVGLTLYFMLFKETPYNSTRKKHLLVEISQMKNTYKGVPFPKNRMLSTPCKDVIAGMLEITPEKRWTVDNVEKSTWLSA